MEALIILTIVIVVNKVIDLLLPCESFEDDSHNVTEIKYDYDFLFANKDDTTSRYDEIGQK